MIKVCIGMSTRGNDLNSDLVRWMIVQSRRTDIDICVKTSRCNVSARKAQNGLFRIARETNADYYLFLDTDIVPIDNVIDVLLEADEDVVTAPIWHYDDIIHDIHLNVHYKSGPTEIERIYTPKISGTELIQSSSFSCLMLRKCVLDKLVELKESPVEWSPLIDIKWKEAENDNIFFAKLKALNIPAYVCWDAKGGIHRRTIDLCDGVLAKFVCKVRDKEEK